ncbi:fecCD transport family protein [[Clostridium] bifermentans ATCC 638]|uniref:FecCD transport family protein n=1 Tax=Paraclostridium bifermentans ATCC 638 = DSM 14991 TaxID=1233171 RepID=T4VN18_PARBF|nr:ABC transporter permease [Paraclostridium bifermentans]EQK42062.1 fecCD transport family protein [[Clostridium] bifermentans ATCC 638] [Paraclostridium bifermentans ATCC 638 = DSM 14991]RIZ58821.1 iron ABC transporter permease [Paraclostridium bifermentans]UAG18928.1 ABC transporter permease [Paraclostridium bifermentans]UOW68644.1 ABC transporter permease [Paraclostridium bifermentans]
MKKRYLLIVLILLSITSLFIGVNDITLMDIVSYNKEKVDIFFISRVPRLVSILLAGLGMSICGLIMQQVSRNKFVSPTTGATIDSAQLGLVFAMLIIPSTGLAGKMIASFAFALAGTFIFMKILKSLKFKNAVFVPLIGIMFGNIIGSATTFIAYKYNLMQDITAWMQGNFSMIIKGNYEMLYITIPCIIMAYIYANKFTIAGMGEDFATNLGLNYNKVVNLGLMIVAIVTVCVVITAGSIPFIGLIVPNIVSMYKGDNLKDSIWHTGLFGAIFVLICDIFSRTVIYPYEIPIGLTVGAIGSIIFLFMILRRGNHATA